MAQKTTVSGALKLFSTLAVRAPFDKGVLSGYDSAPLPDIEWSPTTVIETKLADRQHADLIIATDGAIQNLVEKGLINPDDSFPLISAYIGVAVQRGAKRPDISTTESFLTALRDARSVAYSLSGASGIYLQKLLKDLQAYDGIAAKATKVEQGFTAEKLVSGEADLAVQQMSELMVVEGIDIVGPLPDDVQQLTPFAVAITNDCRDVPLARSFIDYLFSEPCRQLYLQYGLRSRQ